VANLPPPPGQPRETAADTGYSGGPAWAGRESPGGRGWGRGPLGRRRGSGPPCPRWVAGLRGRTATLGLRHGPDSYGRQQWGILRNGGNPDAATPRAGRRPSGRKPLSAGKNQMTVPAEEAPANYVPAAAVIRRGRALSGIIGRKARAGGRVSGHVEAGGSTPGSIPYRAARAGQGRTELPV
jgi:hypothetical protein